MKYQEMKDTLNEMKNTFEGIESSLVKAEE